MIIDKNGDQCSVCAMHEVCKNKDALRQFNKEIRQVKVGYPELKTRIVCEQFKATRYI